MIFLLSHQPKRKALSRVWVRSRIARRNRLGRLVLESQPAVKFRFVKKIKGPGTAMNEPNE
jgi:hypothetical protein